jgi:hypothetical protein
MLFDPKHVDRLAKLEEELRCATAVTSVLMSNVMTIACVRVGALGSATKGQMVDRGRIRRSSAQPGNGQDSR